MNKAWLFILLFCGVFSAFGQENTRFRLHIRKATGPIAIDGLPGEAAWWDTDVASDFFMVTPIDDRKSGVRTEIRMTYDADHIYLLAFFFNGKPGPYYVESLRRDFIFGKNDNFLLFLDPFNNQTTGFTFGANASGAQWDGTMYNGGKVDLNWDTKWVSAVTQDEEKWVFEMALPFKSIRYQEGVREWRINFSRLDLNMREKSSWTPIPRQFPTASLAYTGVLVWDSPPPPPGANFSLIPYLTSAVSGDGENGQGTEFKVGGDAKVSLSSSLNLDLTINPDFSQVEVDRQVTNLDRFELFFPEKRQFFLENGDLFADFGYDNIRPFFSRRIGLGVPIRAGARVSGNLSRKWRLGLMDMQTASVEETGLPSQNFGVLTLQRQVFGRSSLGLMFVNKEATAYPDEADSLRRLYPKFNRNLGLEYNLASADNRWTGKAFFLKSFSPLGAGNGISQAANLEYSSRRWNWGLKEEYVAEDYNAEVGFVPRQGYIGTRAFGSHLFLLDRGPVVSHGPYASSHYFFNPRVERTDYRNLLGYQLNFLNSNALSLEALEEFVILQAPFDPTRSGKESLETGTRHYWKGLQLAYTSKPQSMFTYAFSGYTGGYYAGGERLNLYSELGYRFQPYVSLSSAISYNHIQLPGPWNTTDFWLIGSEVDFTFTNKLFWATLFQYNEQAQNFNLNSRLQWRYQPASDLFLVFTNNRLYGPGGNDSWSLNLKLLYWFTP